MAAIGTRTTERRRPFTTLTVPAVATNGATSGAAPADTSWFTFNYNCQQIIVNNLSATETLYLYAISDLDTTYDLDDTIEIAPGAYLTLTVGVRTDRVGTDYAVGFTTAAVSFDYKVTLIYSVNV